MLFLIALMGLVAAVAGSSWSFVGQRDKERELLFVGREYRRAIERYRQAHASQSQAYPTSLNELLGNSDKLNPQRYLRRLYADPMTGSAEWGLVRSPQGGIVGIYSLSMRKPVRTQGTYADERIDFARAGSYRDWVFTAARNASTAAADTPQDTDAPEPTRELAPDPPGWNYTRDGSPPPRWKDDPSPPTLNSVPP